MSEDKFTLDNNSNEDVNNTLASGEINVSEDEINPSKDEINPSKGEINPSKEEINPSEGEINPSEEEIHTDDTIQSYEDNTTDEAVDDEADDEADIKTDIEADIEADKPTGTEPIAAAKKSKLNIYKLIRILCTIGCVIFTALFINEVIIQPYRIKKSIDFTRELYNKPTERPTATLSPTQVSTNIVTVAPTPVAASATPTPDPNRDVQGRLLQFKDLLATNEEVKGWLTIPDTNIYYVVMQSGADDPNYYLHKDISKDYSKAGTLYLDPRSSVEENSQNFVIYGHNMVSTVEKMFHTLLKYKEGASYYKKHPLISFDTIYNTGKWKIFAVFITTPNVDKKYFFDYRKSNFTDSSDFLNFVYQLRIRSLLNIGAVDINENDQLLTLSTCSYEINSNYRTVIVARKVREGEDLSVDVDSASVNDYPLYAEDYYNQEGGKAPELAATFEEALANGDIHWYITPTGTPTE